MSETNALNAPSAPGPTMSPAAMSASQVFSDTPLGLMRAKYTHLPVRRSFWWVWGARARVWWFQGSWRAHGGWRASKDAAVACAMGSTGREGGRMAGWVRMQVGLGLLAERAGTHEKG
jgi:hypothetical protein